MCEICDQLLIIIPNNLQKFSGQKSFRLKKDRLIGVGFLSKIRNRTATLLTFQMLEYHQSFVFQNNDAVLISVLYH